MVLKFGGRQITRPSFSGWWKHAMWSPDGVKIYEYGPCENLKIGIKTPPPIYKGKARQVLSETIIREMIVDGKMVTEKTDVTEYLRGQLCKKH